MSDRLAYPFKTCASDARMSTLPIPVIRKRLWDLYCKARRAFWHPEEINTSEDIDTYRTLDAPLKHIINRALAMFANSDGIVNVNLVQCFMQEIDILEVKYFYGLQFAIENVHAEVYAKILIDLVVDQAECDKLIHAPDTIPVIGKMSKWMYDTIDKSIPLVERLFRMALVEGVFFQGQFLLIYYLEHMKIKLPGIFQSNRLISIDEGMHTMFAIELMNMAEPEFRISKKTAHELIIAAVDISREYAEMILPEPILGLNVNEMMLYIESLCDNLLILLGFDPLYESVHNFEFMEKINMRSHVCFFERRSTEYGISGGEKPVLSNPDALF